MITVKDNALEVANNFEQQIKEQPNIIKTALGRTAEFLMFLIKQRTAKGISADGNAFPKYTAEYAFLRKKAGRQTSTPDLNFSGQMLSNITQRSNPNYAIIYFANKFQNVKALGNQTKRKFFSIGYREQQPIINVFMKEFNKLSKI
jgi:phage gpG-like protein